MIIRIIFIIILMIFCIRMYHRNQRVYSFQLKILNMAKAEVNHQIDEGRENYLAPYSLLDKHTYEDMLFSFKPLKLEAWFTKEELKMLKGEGQL